MEAAWWHTWPVLLRNRPAKTLVGVAASAGGLEALRELFTATQPDKDTAYVVIQHLAPDKTSLMPSLLARSTNLIVEEVTDGAVPVGGRIYVLGPGVDVVLEGQQLRLVELQASYPRLPIDRFFVSLAEVYRENAVGVVLSGTGTDGSQGVLAVKAQGGRVLIQDPSTAAFDGMPAAAIESGTGDVIAPPPELAQALVRLPPIRVDEESPPPPFGRLLAAIKHHVGVDLSGYKAGTLLRRIEAHQQRLGLSLEAMAQQAELEPGRASEILSDLMVTVTDFFRDPAAFEAVIDKVLLPRLTEKPVAEPLRLWVAGCATGQEAYSLAILVDEAIEQLGQHRLVKIFATDVDPASLERAAAGVYTIEEVQRVSEARRERYFTRSAAGQYAVNERLRGHVVFARHDVIEDPPFSRVDLVSCRNLVIFLEAEQQRRVYSVLHFAARPDGYVMLGSSELPPTGGAFETVDHVHRLFRVRGGGLGAHVMNSRDPHVPALTVTTSSARPPVPRQVPPVVLDAILPGAWLVCDLDRRVLYTHGDMRQYLDLSAGVPQATLDGLFEGSFVSLVLTTMGEVIASGAPCSTQAPLDDRMVTLVIEALPKLDAFLVRLDPPPEHTRGSDNVVQFSSEDLARLRPLHDEIASLRAKLRATTEEREAAHEELQATNEELMSSNEELQSSNEELQSTNEELHTVNAELLGKIEELSTTTADLENLFRNIGAGVIYLDATFRLRRFNPPATSFVPIGEHDRGRFITDFASRLDIDLGEVAGEALKGWGLIRRDAHDPQGRIIAVMAAPYQTESYDNAGVVITLTDVTPEREAYARNQVLAAALRMAGAYTAVLDGRLRFVHLDTTLAQECGGSALDLVGHDASSFLTSEPPLPDGLRVLVDSLDRTHPWDGTLRLIRPSGSSSVLRARLFASEGSSGTSTIVLIADPLTPEETPDAAVERLSLQLQRLALVAMWELRPASDSAAISPEMATMLGVPPAFLSSTEHVFEHIHPRDRSTVERALEEAVAQGKAYRLAIPVEHPTHPRMLLSTAFPSGHPGECPAELITGIQQDITNVLFDHARMTDALIAWLPTQGPIGTSAHLTRLFERKPDESDLDWVTTWVDSKDSGRWRLWLEQSFEHKNIVPIDVHLCGVDLRVRWFGIRVVGGTTGLLIVGSRWSACALFPPDPESSPFVDVQDSGQLMKGH